MLNIFCVSLYSLSLVLVSLWAGVCIASARVFLKYIQRVPAGFACCFFVSDPPEFSPEQPVHIQVQEDDMATIPLLVSANPEKLSCKWLNPRGKLVKGDPTLCDGFINQVLVELSQQVSTQLCHSGSE